MPIFSLDLKCNLVNITNVFPSDPDNFRWHFKFRCSNCGEAKDSWFYVVGNEEVEVPNSRDVAHLVSKCKLCSRQNTVSIVPRSFTPYTIENSEKFQSLMKLECRGIEPIDFDFRNGWRGDGPESGTKFEDIDLTEKEWSDYDEKISEAVEINEITVRFTHTK